MLRPDMLLALSLTGTSVDALLRTDFAVRRHPSYTGAWPLPWPDFHRLEDTCFLGTPYKERPGPRMARVFGCSAVTRVQAGSILQ